MILCVCILLNVFFNERSGFRHRLLQSIHSLLLIILGCVIGFLPFLYYLISTQSLNGFLKHFVYLSDIAKIAKTPFIPYALSASNCFVFATYFMGAMLISYIILVKRKNISEATLRISAIRFCADQHGSVQVEKLDLCGILVEVKVFCQVLQRL